MEHSTTVRAESVERAIKIGLTKLNITKEQATINIISEGKKGFFGFGKQDAIVEISKQNVLSEITISPVTDDIKIEVEVPTSTTTPTEEVAVGKTTSIEEESTIEVVEEAVAPSTIETNEKTSNIDELMQEHLRVAKYLEDVIAAYGAESTITVEQTKNQLIFNIDTDKSGLIIGKHGKIINALQILAQVMVHHYDKRRQSVILNIGDYRVRRLAVLEQLAKRTAREVLKTKRNVVLEPLPSYERKLIHAYLSKIENIETHSEGRDPNRYLVVEYKA